jgi:hypothetical protein
VDQNLLFAGENDLFWNVPASLYFQFDYMALGMSDSVLFFSGLLGPSVGA